MSRYAGSVVCERSINADNSVRGVMMMKRADRTVLFFKMRSLVISRLWEMCPVIITTNS